MIQKEHLYPAGRFASCVQLFRSFHIVVELEVLVQDQLYHESFSIVEHSDPHLRLPTML
jgi:hypothetical protein